MGRPLRMYEQDEFYFVTARTTQARLFFRPSEELNEVAGGVLARAVERYELTVYAYVFASNHVHLLVRARDGVLSRFMQYLKSNLARKVGRLIDWRGTFWDGRFSAAPVLDDGAMEDRLKYILAHGVKEGLVRNVEEWPGLSCAAHLLGNLRRSFRWFNWAQRWMNGVLKEGGAALFSDEWAEPVELELSWLPSWSALDDAAKRERLQQLIAAIEAEGRTAHPSPMGRTAVERQDPQRRPERCKRSRRPLCHAKLGDLRTQFLEKYRAFRDAYRAASARFRAGELDVCFPALAFRPSGFGVRSTPLSLQAA